MLRDLCSMMDAPINDPLSAVNERTMALICIRTISIRDDKIRAVMRLTIPALLLACTAYAQAPAPVTPENPENKVQTELDRAQKILKDWANLGRYSAENASVSAPATGEKRVVFMGDSITDAWGRRYGKFFPGKPYINRGISGQTTPQMLIRFRPDVIALKPKAVVILASTNDIAGNTGPMTPEKIRALNAWLKDYASKTRAVYLDYYSAMVDDKGMLKTELTYDGLHPNDAGYVVIEPLAQKAIDAALR